MRTVIHHGNDYYDYASYWTPNDVNCFVGAFSSGRVKSLRDAGIETHCYLFKDDARIYLIDDKEKIVGSVYGPRALKSGSVIIFDNEDDYYEFYYSVKNYQQTVTHYSKVNSYFDDYQGDDDE